MFKRRLNGKMLTLLGVLLLAVCVSAFAGLRDGSWEVNPSAFRYDMSLYFKLADADYEDLDQYEIGAFVGDECRGLAEKLVLTEDESCLYMRIRSNKSEGEVLDFLLRNKESGDTVVVKAADGADFIFKSGSRVGMPSEPFMMARYFNVSLGIEGNGTVDFTDGLYKAGTVLDLKAVPAVGYSFGSWSTGSTDPTLSLTVEKDTELTVTFTPSLYTITYMLDGEKFAKQEVAYGAAVEAPEAPIKEGYSFNGWEGLPETMPAENLTITGSYTINTYAAVFKVDGEVVSSVEVEYNAPIPTPATPKKDGYVFNGWGSIPETMPAHDIEMHGSFSVQKFLLSFVVDGETIYSGEIACDTPITAPSVPAKEGYSFSGWGEIPDVMPAHALEVKGSYIVNNYKLVFKAGDEVVLDTELAYGTSITVPQAPEKEGYSFSDWGYVPAEMPAHDLEVTGTYTVNSYKITFAIEGEKPVTADLEYGAPILAPEAPGREGYTFLGWGDVPETMPAEDLSFTGTYEINKYKLTFLIGEKEIAASEIEFGSKVEAPAAPESEGHTFTGWSSYPEVMPAHDLVVRGNYTVNEYNITFSIGDEEFYTGKLAYGASIVAPEAPVRDGYKFVGWGEVPTVMPAEDLAFSGSYEATEFNVVYKLDGEVVYTAKGKIGEAVPAYAAPEKEGYSFSGWGEIPAVMPAQDLEFGGTYSVNSYVLTFRIGEDVVFEGKLTYGAEISIPDAPEKEGHSFAGWKDVPATMPARDLVFDSSYAVNTYSIKYFIDEVEFLTQEYEFGAPVEAPAAPDQEGHSFSGWGEVPETMPAHDVMLGGTYAENFYTVTFRIDGIVLFTDDVEYGASIKVPEVPEREGHSFSGWSEVPASMPAYNLEYDGTYTANTYAVTFRIGDMVIYEGTLVYGAEVTAPEAPVAEGHTFVGWGVVPATMPASDLVVTGSYEVNSYNVSFSVDGESFYSVTLPYGSAISAPEPPVKEGYSFVAWKNLPTSVPANDLVVEGTYNVNNYNLSFKIGEDEIFAGSIAYGSEITAPEAPAKEGHSFAGWGMVPATMPASDLEINGSYDVNIYSLTVMIDGEQFHKTEVPYGTTFNVPTAPEKEGYSFVGWSEVPATMPASDLTVSGTYAINSYKLSFKADDVVVFEGDLTYGSEISIPEAPAMEGHTFSGWGIVPATMPAGDLAVSGTYSVNSYDLTYRIDGEDFYTVQVPFGSQINVPEAPAKEGHSFTGWADALATMPANNVVISGSYAVNSYALTFKVGEEIVFEGQIPYGAEVSAPEGPAKEGHTFNGWGMVPATMPASDIVFNGTYQVNIYNLTFDIDGEAFFETQLAYGTEISVPTQIPDKDGHHFGGWGDVPATMPANNLNISGTYAVNHYTLTFRVGEDIIFTGEQPYGSEIIAPEDPVKEGHTFMGWSEYPATIPADNVEVLGEFKINQYELKFTVEGVDLYTRKVTYGDPVELPEVPEKPGHTFAGFGVVPATMPASDLHLTGGYEVNSYNVTFKIGEDIYYVAQVPYQGTIDVPSAPVMEGFTFAGWEGVPSVMPAYDVVVEGSYSANPYNLIFKLDGETIYQEDKVFGAEITVPDVEEKEGYTFSGWGVVPPTMPAADLEINGTYDINHYNLVFRVGEEVIVSAQVAYGTQIQAPAEPKKEGHTFLGWNDVPSTMPAKDVEIVSGFDVNRYMLTFMLDGEQISSKEVAFGDAVEVPEVAEKEGYMFSGWGVVPATMPASDVVLSGVYDINYYNVVFRVGEDVIFSARLPYGAEMPVPADPVREGWSFFGWGEVPAVMPASDLEFQGAFTINSYKVVFRLDGEVISEESLLFGAPIEVPEVADKEGYTFGGFGIVPAVVPAADLEFNGVYEVNSYSVIFKINDDVVYSAQLPYGSEIVAPEAPSSEGSTFSGWSSYPSTVPAEDVVVTGTYTANIYKAVFKIDGEVFRTVEVPYLGTVEAPEAPEKEGYTFSGWDEVPALMPAHDIEINGKYTVNVYKAVFKIDGEVVETLEVPYGSEVKAPEVEEREGYTFSGWTSLPETMPAGDIEVTGSYTANRYVLVFKIGEEVISVAEVAYGSEIELPEAPEKEGYTFAGWTDVPETMPARDLVIIGDYTVNRYRLLVYLNDEVYIDEEVAYGAEVVVPDPEVEYGYKFDGWQEAIPTTMPAHDVEIHGTVSEDETVYVAGVYVGESVTVYTVDGVLLYKDVKTSDIKERLTPGVYIVNGKKVVIR